MTTAILRPRVVLAMVTLGALASTWLAPAASAVHPDGHYQVVFHSASRQDPVAIKEIGNVTYVLDSGLQQGDLRGALDIETNVDSGRPTITTAKLPNTKGIAAAFDLDPYTGDAYVVQRRARQIDVISAGGHLTRAVSLQGRATAPDAVGVDPGADLVYVGDDVTGNVLVLDEDTLQVIKTLHPVHSHGGITSLAVDTADHEVWAGSRGGLVFLIGLTNTGVHVVGSSYDANHHGDADAWPTSVALYQNPQPDSSIRLFSVHGRVLSEITDAEAYDRLADPGQQDVQQTLLPLGDALASAITIDPQAQCAYVVVPNQHRVIGVDIGFIIDDLGFMAPYTWWTLPSSWTPEAAVVGADPAGEVTVVGHEPDPYAADQHKDGFLQVDQPIFDSYPFPGSA